MTTNTLAPKPPKPMESPRNRPGRSELWLHLLLLGGSLIMLLPFLWMLSTSLKAPSEIFTFPPRWIPSDFAWENYRQTVTVMPFGRFYLNSLIVAASVTVVQLFTSSLAAFAFARLRFKGRTLLFLLYLATLMIPFHVMLIPNFILMRYFRWIDTYAALILPPAFSAFSTFLLRQYYLSLPLDLDEAARIDGASSLRIWSQIIVPLSGPVLAALTIFIFLGSWNDFLWPLVITNSLEMRTLPVGLTAFQGQYKTDWHLLMAGAVIAMVPVLTVYILAQKRFIEGLAMTGVTGR